MVNELINEEKLKYPNMKADLSLCGNYINNLGNIIWGKKTPQIEVPFSIPPRPNDCDIQLQAALEELNAYRASGLEPMDVIRIQRLCELYVEAKMGVEDIQWLIDSGAKCRKLEAAGRLKELPCNVGDMVYAVCGPGSVLATKVVEICFQEDRAYVITKNRNEHGIMNEHYFALSNFGESIFPTPEEAQTALPAAPVSSLKVDVESRCKL